MPEHLSFLDVFKSELEKAGEPIGVAVLAYCELFLSEHVDDFGRSRLTWLYRSFGTIRCVSCPAASA